MLFIAHTSNSKVKWGPKIPATSNKIGYLPVFTIVVMIMNIIQNFETKWDSIH